jgi:hypothetical protein
MVTLDLSRWPTWRYIVTNTGQQPNWITAFTLRVHAPVSAISSPSSWAVHTDNSAYIIWANFGKRPYALDIAPGQSAEFEFRSHASPVPGGFALVNYDHVADTAAALHESGRTDVPGAPICAEDVTAQVEVRVLSYDPIRRIARVQVRNQFQAVIAGPLSITYDEQVGLGVPDGRTTCARPMNRPFKHLLMSGLSGFETRTLDLMVQNPEFLKRGLALLSGPGVR